MKNHKNIGFSSNTVPDSLKNRSYQASFQCWGIIGTPVKRHLMAFRWRAHDGPLIVVLGSSLPSLTKKKKKQKKQKKTSKLDPLWQNFLDPRMVNLTWQYELSTYEEVGLGSSLLIFIVVLFVCLFDLILYVPSTIFQLYRDGSSWVEPVLS